MGFDTVLANWQSVLFTGKEKQKEKKRKGELAKMKVLVHMLTGTDYN